MMKNQACIVFAICLFTISALSSDLIANSNEKARIESATEVLKDIMDIPENSVPPSLLREAYGIAVIPGVIKAGMGIGGRHGKGVISVRLDHGDWSDPSFLTITGGSIGWQIGIQSTDIILVFRNEKSVDAILDGRFTLGADASIAAGPVGRHIGAKTDVEFKSEIYSYSQSRGIFAGIALEGAALQIDHNANASFYENKDISPREIFETRRRLTPGCVDAFKRALRKYADSDR